MSDAQRIFELDELQCRQLLASHKQRLGRIAFAEAGDPNWPSVLPVNYAYHDGRIYIRTLEGSKLYAALRHQQVAFEIDAVDEQWREGWSVVALGPLELVVDAAEQATVEPLLRSWVAGGDQRMVRLDIRQLTGREVVGGPPA